MLRDAKIYELVEAAKLLVETKGVFSPAFYDRKERLAAAVRDFEASSEPHYTRNTGQLKREAFGPEVPKAIVEAFFPPKPPMTEQDALNEALRLWGPDGSIYIRKLALRPCGKFWVGCPTFRDYQGQHIYGNGDTWELAFVDAAQRQEKMVR